MLVELAVLTGIPPSVWADEGEETIVTALDVLRGGRRERDGRRMSG